MSSRDDQRPASMDRMMLEFRGKQIIAALNQGQTLTGEVLPREEPPMWYLTIGGTALGKLPALPGETEKSVRDRVVAWLESHPDMLDRDQIILGGG